MTSQRSSWAAGWLAVRSLAFAALLPGVFAGLIPWRYLGLSQVSLDVQNARHLLGLLLIAIGGTLLAACIWEFARRGRGTLAPVDPPRHLVVSGLYRSVRNPMYLSVATLQAGECLLIWSRGMLLYWIAFLVCVNIFVISYEERTLRHRFGESYERYCREVGRWLPRIPGPGGDSE